MQSTSRLAEGWGGSSAREINEDTPIFVRPTTDSVIDLKFSQGHVIPSRGYGEQGALLLSCNKQDFLFLGGPLLFNPNKKNL